MGDGDFSATDYHWMQLALHWAHRAAASGEVPVGAVLVSAQDKLLGAGGNQPVSAHDPSAHAEIIALRQAGQSMQNYRFPGSVLYVTLEPCTMCVGALIHARVSRVVFAAREPRAGALVSACQLLAQGQYNHYFQFQEGLLAEASSDLLRRFFRERR